LDKKKLQIQNPKSKTQNRKVSPARKAAFEILLKIEKEKAFSAVLLPLYEEKLGAKDRALCHELTLGVLRKKIYLDLIIKQFIKAELKKLDPEVLISMRLGIYQLLFLDKIPAFAAINESVILVRQAKKTSASGLVNAVLRNVERQKIFQFEFTEKIEKVSVETSHPRWLIELWTKNFGFEETYKLAKANNETPQMAFRLTNKSDEKTIEILTKLGLEIEESKIVQNAWRVLKGSDFLRAYADEGKIYFQEESSQLVAHAVNLQKGERFLDFCAAPGSKTTLIASLRVWSLESGVVSQKPQTPDSIIAGDKHFHRLRVLKENCQKVGVDDVRIVAYDAETGLPFADETFDCVLIDAPCSGTGTIRHNPEIRYFLKPEDFAELSGKQLQILENASKVLKKGGRLIYSTCSLERIENETVVEKFLTENQNFKKIEPKSPRQFLTAEGFARTFPQRDQTDGFFIAALKKN
jgi:16S rRNA (cytosine967-C5)-methyltransferase